MIKSKKIHFAAILFLIAVFVFLSNFIAKTALSEIDDEPIGSIDTMSGFDASVAFNPDNDTWMMADSGDSQIQTKLISNNNSPVTGVNSVDNHPGGGVKIAYSKDIKKFLVLWVTNPSENTSRTFARFVNSDNTNSGEIIDVDNSGGLVVWSSFSNANRMNYDSRNKRFVVSTADYHQGIVLWTVSISGQATKTIIAPQTAAESVLLGQTAVNEDKNEYCVNFFYGGGSQNQGRTPTLVPVNASNYQIGTTSRMNPPRGDGGWIAYNSVEKIYFLVFNDFTDGMAHGQILGTNCAYGNSDAGEDFIVDTSARMLVYNPASNTYGITYEATDASNPNPVVIFESSGNQIGIYSPFVWDTSIMHGLYYPGVAPNTNNGTYAATTSRNYGTMQFITEMGTGNVTPGQDSNSFPTPTPITSPQGYPGIGNLIAQLLQWSIRILGIAVFIMTFYGGLLWFLSRGNSGQITQAKNKITNAILGAILLLSAYLILYTVNPDLVRGTFNLPGAGISPGTPGGPGATCNNPQTLATQYHEPFPNKNAPQTDTLISCIQGKLQGQNLGEISSFDRSHAICNYTRGNTACGTCSHAVNSCHYGGHNGTSGAMAVDFGNEVIGNQIIQAAIACGAKDARCENGNGERRSCTNGGANHVHVTTGGCDAN